MVTTRQSTLPTPELQRELDDVRRWQGEIDQATLELINAVQRARARKASWPQIAAALGTTPEAARQRFYVYDPAVPATRTLRGARLLHRHPDGWPKTDLLEHVRQEHPDLHAAHGGALVATSVGEDVMSRIWASAHTAAHGGDPNRVA